MQEIVLAPLAREDVGQLIADSLHCDRERAAPLAQLVHEKTAGNPFFVIQFLSALAEEGLLTFDHGAARWSWDLTRIHAKGYTDNVVDLMVGKLSRLPIDTQEACSSSPASATAPSSQLLAMVCEDSEEELHRDLREAFANRTHRPFGGLLSVRPRPGPGSGLLADPGRSRAEAHLRIGRLLAAHTPPEKREKRSSRSSISSTAGSRLMTSTRRTRAAGRAQSDRGQARQGVHGLRLGAELSHRRRGTVAGGLLGAPARAHLRAGAARAPNASS